MVAVQDLLKRIRKPDILLLRPLWAPLGVLSGTEELFVFIPPQQVFCMGFAVNAARSVPDLHCLCAHCDVLPKKF